MESQNDESPQQDWTPLMIDASRCPEMSAEGKPTASTSQTNFFRSSRWCPDGIAALSHCEDRSLQVSQYWRSSVDSADYPVKSIDVKTIFEQPAPILEYAWYPGAAAGQPGSYCFLASVRDCPVKLLDAGDKRIRASYRIVDHRERHVAPHSISFNCAASRIYCGYEDAIEVFDFQRPGEGVKLATTPSKKSKDGMKGIVSSISFCPDYSGLFAASSLSGAITLLSEQAGEDPIAYLGGMTGAITQVKFNPMQPHLLYASQRRSDEILCWDIREPFEILQRFKRAGSSTNQKLLFDIDMTGRWLASGDQTGHISVFDVQSESVDPVLKFKAHDDAIGSVAFNPTDSSLLSVSGSRHFPGEQTAAPSSDNSDSSDESDVDSDGEVRLTGVSSHGRPFAKDTSVKIWSFPKLEWANAEDGA